MTLQTRFLFSFLSVSLIGIAVTAAAVMEIAKAAREADQLYESVVLPMDHLLDLTEDFQRIRINLRDFVDAPTPETRKAAEETMAMLEQKEAQAAAEFGQHRLTPQGRDLFLKYVEARTKYSALLKTMLSLFLTGKTAEGRQLMTGEAKQQALLVQQLLDGLRDGKTSVAREETGQRQFAVDLYLALAVLAVVLSVIFAVLASRSIGRAVGSTVQAMEALAEFRLPKLADASLNRKDELGALVRAVRRYSQTWALGQEAVKGASNRLRTASLELDQATVDTEAAADRLRRDISSIAAAAALQSGAMLRVAAGANTTHQAAELVNRAVSDEEGTLRLFTRALGETLVLLRQAPDDPLVQTIRTQLEVLDRQNVGAAAKLESLDRSAKDLLKAVRGIDQELTGLLSSSQSIKEASDDLETASFQVTDLVALTRQTAVESLDLSADLAGLVHEVRE